jgi:hypothetical protein
VCSTPRAAQQLQWSLWQALSRARVHASCVRVAPNTVNTAHHTTQHPRTSAAAAWLPACTSCRAVAALTDSATVSGSSSVSSAAACCCSCWWRLLLAAARDAIFSLHSGSRHIMLLRWHASSCTHVLSYICSRLRTRSSCCSVACSAVHALCASCIRLRSASLLTTACCCCCCWAGIGRGRGWCRSTHSGGGVACAGVSDGHSAQHAQRGHVRAAARWRPPSFVVDLEAEQLLRKKYVSTDHSRFLTHFQRASAA